MRHLVNTEVCLRFPALVHHECPAPQNPFELVLRLTVQPGRSPPHVVVETASPKCEFHLNTVQRRRHRSPTCLVFQWLGRSSLRLVTLCLVNPLWWISVSRDIVWWIFLIALGDPLRTVYFSYPPVEGPEWMDRLVQYGTRKFISSPYFPCILKLA